MGDDSEGVSYGSANILWDDNKQEWYSRQLAYWNQQEASEKGVLSGYDIVSPVDLKASSYFLEQIAKLPPSRGGPCEFNCVLDGGAGIGRVTSGCLINYFKQIDLLEPVPHLLSKAKEILRNNEKIGHFFLTDLQSFHPEVFRYDCFWFQWCVLYLTDDDLIALLRRAKAALRPNGVICVKENVILEGDRFHVDREDNSLMRSDAHYRRLFAEAGLELLLEMRQPRFPASLFPVFMYCLR